MPSRPASRVRAGVGSAFFLVLAPGGTALLVPWLLTRWEVQGGGPAWAVLRVVGLLLCIAGGVVLTQAFVRFVVEGVGTPAPVAPTDRLVVGGAYRYVRNPMYLAVLALIVGQGFLLRQPVLLLYGGLFLAVTASFVHFYEEPTLRRQFPADYDLYRYALPGWLPRRHPYVPAERP